MYTSHWKQKSFNAVKLYETVHFHFIKLAVGIKFFGKLSSGNAGGCYRRTDTRHITICRAVWVQLMTTCTLD